MPPLATLEDMLDPPPAALNAAPEPPEAAEDPAEEAPRVVMLMPLVPLLAPDPRELLDVIRTELLVLPEPPDAALPPDAPALRERSPIEEKKGMKGGEHLPPHYDKLQWSFIILYYMFC